MFADFLQFLITGTAVGATYALVGLGFTIIYNASHVINFAQGEFLMVGGMGSVFFISLGMPMPLAILGAVVLAIIIGLLLEKFAIEPARNSEVVSIIIITIGASILLRGVAQLVWGKEFHKMETFSGDQVLHIAGAVVQPQQLWVIGITTIIVSVLAWFFNRTMLGKAILATSYNPDAAQLMGISTRVVLFIAFGLSAALGAIAGAIVTPITFTSYDVGIMLGLKGFVAAVLGGLGNSVGAVAGGLILGIAEIMTAGYLSSAYKDAVPFVLILLILFFMPSGLFGVRGTERV